MRIVLLGICAFAVAGCGVSLASEPDAGEPRLVAARLLDRGRRSSARASGDAALAPLRTAAEQAAEALGPESYQAARIRAAVAEHADAPKLSKALKSIRDDLIFEPVMEAPLPEGFPGMTPVGELVLKRYPAYRMAQADMTGSSRRQREGSAFSQLFNHIKSNNVAMTAPVRMDYAAAGDRLRQQAMAFLYESPRQGRTGPDGPVRVIDVPESWALSIGYRGNYSADDIDDAQQRFDQWIREHAAEYELAGPLRVMGWNSPWVWGAKRYFEVQQPVRPRQPGTPPASLDADVARNR